MERYSRPLTLHARRLCEPIWRLLLLIVCMTTVTSSVVGCGGNATSSCKAGQDKLKSCSNEITAAIAQQGSERLPIQISDACTAQDNCLGSCLSAGDCDSIAFVISGGMSDPNASIPPGVKTLGEWLSACT